MEWYQTKGMIDSLQPLVAIVSWFIVAAAAAAVGDTGDVSPVPFASQSTKHGLPLKIPLQWLEKHDAAIIQIPSGQGYFPNRIHSDFANAIEYDDPAFFEWPVRLT